MTDRHTEFEGNDIRIMVHTEFRGERVLATCSDPYVAAVVAVNLFDMFKVGRPGVLQGPLNIDGQRIDKVQVLIPPSEIMLVDDRHTIRDVEEWIVAQTKRPDPVLCQKCGKNVACMEAESEDAEYQLVCQPCAAAMARNKMVPVLCQKCNLNGATMSIEVGSNYVLLCQACAQIVGAGMQV